MFRSKESTGLPTELVLEIFSYLNMKDLTSAARVNSYFKNCIYHKSFWKPKLELHFPYLYDELKNKENVDWYEEFRKAYVVEYKKLNPITRELFFAVKTLDLYKLKRLPLELESLDTKDSNGNTLLSWAQKPGNQSMLDYIYQVAILQYTNPQAPIIDTEKKDRSRRTILYWALACRQPAEHIELLFQQGSKPDEKYLDDVRPVHLAASLNLLQTLKSLVEKDSLSLFYPNKFGETPLLSAAIEGHVAIVRYLLDKAADPDEAVNDSDNPAAKQTAIYFAVEYNYPEIVQMLITSGATLDFVTDRTNQQIIHLAAKKGRLEIIKMLLTINPDLLEALDAYRQTPLLWASRKGHTEVVHYCLSKGANVHVKSTNGIPHSNGKNPLFWAAENGHAEIVKLLLDAGAQYDVTLDRTKLQPVHVAAQNGYADVIRILLEKDRTLVQQLTDREETPLSLAAENGYQEIVEYLLSFNPNVNTTTCWRPNYADYGKTSLMLAAQNGHHEVVLLLLQAGANPNATFGVDRRTAIHLAAINGHLRTLKVLLEHHPETLEQADKHGETPLLHAVQQGHEMIVHYLIGRGCNVNAIVAHPVTGEDNVNALYLAMCRGFNGIVILLLKAGAKLDRHSNVYVHQLNDEAKSLLSLEAYRASREEQGEYTRSFTLFGITQTFGASKQRKLEAVEKLKEVYFFGKNELALVNYEYELNNGELGQIYQSLKKK